MSTGRLTALLEAASALLLSPTSSVERPEAWFGEVCEMLRLHGMPLWRAATSVVTLHPEIFVLNLVWKQGESAQSIARPPDQATNDEYKRSPIAAIAAGSDTIRQRLIPGIDVRFPALDALRNAGGTDYVILPLLGRDRRRNFISFATNDDAGFSDEQLDALQKLAPYFSLRMEAESTYLATDALLHTYLGASAARRVLSGEVRRGQGTLVPAAIWYCDLRGFTALAAAQPVEAVVRLLNSYFEASVGAVSRNGGEVLKFIGDAMLAIFAIDEHGTTEACNRALRAAEDALTSLEALPATPAAKLSMGVALHLGTVMFGNIGGRDRLDFTVIGAAVNEVARLEGLCRSTGLPLLMTADFAWECRRDDVLPLGAYTLKGVERPLEIATLKRWNRPE